MLIDSLAPNPDASEFHAIEIAAPCDVVYHALRTTNLADSSLVKWLLAFRLLPKLFVRRRVHTRMQFLTLDTLLRAGFGLVAEDPGREVVLGVTGRFWRPIDNTVPFDEENFRGPVRPGFARAVWNFAVREGTGAQTILSTETRVICGDAASRRKFRAYWVIVRPFSGLIRILMLRAVRKTCSG